MLNLLRSSCSVLFRTLITATVCSLVSAGAIPRGWQLMGNLPTAYECDLEAQGGHIGSPGAMLKAKYAGVKGFGSLAQAFRPGNYAGIASDCAGMCNPKL